MALVFLFPALGSVLSFQQIGKVVVDVQLRPRYVYAGMYFNLGELCLGCIFQTLHLFTRNDEAVTVVNVQNNDVEFAIVLGRNSAWPFR